MIDVFEQGNTIQFTWTSSIAPNSAPILKITEGLNSSVIASITALQSDTTHYYALYTIVGSSDFYSGEWFAQKTVNGSAYNFIRRFGFRAVTTQPVV